MQWKRLVKSLMIGTIAGILIYIITGSDSWLGFSLLLFYLDFRKKSEEK